MARSGGGVYSLPGGTTVAPNTTIQSSWANALTADIEQTFNTVQPIIYGGTGAATAGAAADALSPDFANVASGATTNIGAATSPNVNITGTTTITAFDTVAAGIKRFVKFAGALTLTHNATSLILPGAANITTAAGDAFIFVSEGSGNWRCLGYQLANGRALVAPAAVTGSILQSIWATPYTANADLTTAIPSDDTIPQNTEGTQILTLTITPRSASSTLRIRFQGQVTVSTADFIAAALFRDSTASAIAAQTIIPETNRLAMLALETQVAASSTSATTFNLRVGAASTTMRMNGTPTARRLGGVAAATLVCEEISA